MKAIVLCCDKYHIFAYHTILTYEKILPKNFTYLVPYCKNININLKRLSKECKIIFIKCQDSSFKVTMENLLREVDDEEYIYWCSSDNYLDKINKEEFIEVKNLIKKGKMKKYDVISIFSNKKIRRMHQLERIIIDNKNFLLCPEWKEPIFNIWNHQFMKGKIQKAIWNSLDEPKKAKDLDYQLGNLQHRIYGNKTFRNTKNLYLEIPIIKLGENTSRGKMTKNSYDSFINYGIEIPKDFELDENKNLFW